MANNKIPKFPTNNIINEFNGSDNNGNISYIYNIGNERNIELRKIEMADEIERQRTNLNTLATNLRKLFARIPILRVNTSKIDNLEKNIQILEKDLNSLKESLKKKSIKKSVAWRKKRNARIKIKNAKKKELETKIEKISNKVKLQELRDFYSSLPKNVDSYIDPMRTLSTGAQSTGGSKKKKTKRKTNKKKTRKPKVHTGPRGGKYIMRKGKKVYV